MVERSEMQEPEVGEFRVHLVKKKWSDERHDIGVKEDCSTRQEQI